jgi:hypothetical protein
LYIQSKAPSRPTMMAPKTPPITPPTTAVWWRSFAQDGAAVAAKGVPVNTAVAATCVGSAVADGVTVTVVCWRAPIWDVVTLGAAALLQQLWRSVLARQQYVP